MDTDGWVITNPSVFIRAIRGSSRKDARAEIVFATRRRTVAMNGQPSIWVRLFRLLVPTLRVEVAAVISGIAVFLLVCNGAFTGIPSHMAQEIGRGEIGSVILAAGLLLLGAMGLALPFLALFVGLPVYKRRGKLTLFISAVILACVEGGCASECLLRAYQGPVIEGVPVNVAIAGLGLLQLGALLFGGVSVLDDEETARDMLGAGRIEYGLLGVNAGACAAVIWGSMQALRLSPSASALLSVYAVWLAVHLWERLRQSKPHER